MSSLEALTNRRTRLSAMLADRPTRVSHAAIVVAVTVLLCTWAFGVPRFGAPDELDHTTKAYGTAHREMIGSPVPDASPLLRYFIVPKGLISGSPNCFAFHSEINASCSVQVNDSSLTQIDTAAGTYPPEYYAIVGGIARLIGADQSPLRLVGSGWPAGGGSSASSCGIVTR